MAGKPARNLAPQFIELRRPNVARPGKLDAAIQQDALRDRGYAPAVITRESEGGWSSIPETLVMESKGHRALDSRMRRL
jgi:hypothetical protein